MQRILEELNRGVGVEGSLIVSREGLLVAANLREGVPKDRLAGVAGDLIQASREALKSLPLGEFRRLVVSAEGGRILVSDAEVANLVVFTRPEANLGLTLIEVGNAAKRIKVAGRLE